MTNATTPAVGDRVKFTGFRARPWETVGTLVGMSGPYADVKWDGRDTVGTLHASQVGVAR